MSNKIYDMSDIWNDINQSFTSIKMNTTDVNSTISSKLMDLQLNGVSKLTLNKLGQIREATLQIPQVDNLEDAITVLSAAGLSHVDYIAPNTQVLFSNLQFSNNSLALVYEDPTLINNDYYYKIGNSGTGSWSNTGIIPGLIELLTPRKKVPRTFYVTMEGSDTDPNYHGQSYYKAKRTVGAGLAAAAADGNPCVIIVHPGEYPIQPQTLVPKNCTLYGYDARVTKLYPAWDQVASPNNMFLLSSGVKVRGFTFQGMNQEAFTLEGGPPKTGYVFAFNPGEYITRSPYIADCTQIHNLTYEQLTLPIDRENANPGCPIGGGNIYADGSVLDTDSPLRSIVVDSFTAVNPNGVAYAVVNDAIVQLVSVFTNWSRVGIWAHAGGQITTTNSNSTFGDYAFVSTGFRYVVKIDGVANTQNLTASANLANYIETNITSLVSTLMTNYATIPGWSTISSNAAFSNLTSRDTTTLLTELANDFQSGKDQGARFFTYGLFTANSMGPPATLTPPDYVFRTSLKPLFLQSWEVVRSTLKGITANTLINAGTGANNTIDELFNLITDVVTYPENYTVPFQSRIEATSQQFSYAGSGINYNALPYGQRATGVAPDPTTNLYSNNGGLIYATFSTERGDTYLGEDLRIDFERSTIEGQAFSRGVQNIALPLIIGVGG